MGLILKKRIQDNRKAERVHDRRSTDLLAAGQYAAIDVVDQFGDNITVLRQLRGDPLARLHSHHQIDEAQYQAGRRYQKDWETAEQGAQAVDPTKEKVDGGRGPETLPERRMQASDRLAAVHLALGVNARKLVHAFLIEEQHIEHLAIAKFSRSGERWANYYGKLLRDSLDMLAVEYELATGN